MVVELSGEVPFCSNFSGAWEIFEVRAICGDFGPCRSFSVKQCHRTTRNGIDLKNLTEGSLEHRKGAVKFLWWAELGKVMKMELETAKSRNFAGLLSISPQKMAVRN